MEYQEGAGQACAVVHRVSAARQPGVPELSAGRASRGPKPRDQQADG
jgi:hypothetical protein